MVEPKQAILYGFLTIVFLCSYCNPCEYETVEGQQKTFSKPFLGKEQVLPLTWSVRISESTKDVCVCYAVSNCTDYFPDSFSCNVRQLSDPTSLALKSDLTIYSVQQTMSSVQYRQYDRTSSECSLRVIVLPSKPFCSGPTMDRGQIKFECKIATVSPRGFCRIQYEAARQDLVFNVLYKHYDDFNPYATECTFLGKPANGSRIFSPQYRFKMEVLPSMEGGEVYAVSSDWSSFFTPEYLVLMANSQTDSLIISSNTYLTFSCRGYPDSHFSTLELAQGSLFRYQVFSSRLTYSRTKWECLNDVYTFICTGKTIKGSIMSESIQVRTTCRHNTSNMTVIILGTLGVLVLVIGTLGAGVLIGKKYICSRQRHVGRCTSFRCCGDPDSACEVSDDGIHATLSSGCIPYDAPPSYFAATNPACDEGQTEPIIDNMGNIIPPPYNEATKLEGPPPAYKEFEN